MENTNKDTENTNKETQSVKSENNSPNKTFNRNSEPRKDGKPFRKPFVKRPDNKRFENKKLEFSILLLRRVSRTMAGGRRMRFAILLVAKISNGVIGIGKAKSHEISDAIQIALRQAEKNTMRIPMYQGRTFSHATLGEFGATKIQLLPRAKEKGLRALGVTRKLAKMAGIKDGVVKLLTKASSKYNMCSAFINACERLTPNKKTIGDKK